MEQKTLDEVIHNIIELQKKCQEISESEFNVAVANIIKETCTEGDLKNKKFLAEAFQLIHDNIYVTSKVHNNIA